jgi:hypothetical protein
MKEIVYYKMQLSTEKEVVGTWPQLDVPKNYFKVGNNFKILGFREFPNSKPNLENFIVKNTAKLTDVMSSESPNSSIGIFVKEKIKELILSYNIKGGDFYKSTFISKNSKITKKELNDYYFLHLIECTQIIDFQKSKFEDLATNQMIAVEKEDDLPIFKRPIKLFLKEIPDIFRSPYKVEILVSESLKLEMEKTKVSGIWFEKYTWNEFYTEE